MRIGELLIGLAIISVAIVALVPAFTNIGGTLPYSTELENKTLNLTSTFDFSHNTTNANNIALKNELEKLSDPETNSSYGSLSFAVFDFLLTGIAYLVGFLFGLLGVLYLPIDIINSVLLEDAFLLQFPIIITIISLLSSILAIAIPITLIFFMFRYLVGRDDTL